MGSEIRAIVHHSLPVGSIKELANALFKLHNATVIYGYEMYDYTNFGVLGICELGSYLNAANKEQFFLLDTENEFGGVRNFDKSEKVSLAFYEKNFEDDKTVFSTDAFVYNGAFDYRPRSFNLAFNGDTKILADVLLFRRFVKSEMDFYGGTFAIYVDDGGEAAFVEHEIGSHSFLDIVKNLKIDFGDYFLLVSEYMKNPLTEEANPIKTYKVYYDDFKDLIG